MPMIAATAATRATTAAPPVKGAPTLAGGDFALAIAGVFGGGEEMPGAPEVAAGTDDKRDGDRQDDADGGTTLPGIAPVLDPALAWLPFAPIDAAVVAPAAVTIGRDAIGAPPIQAANARVAVSASPTIDQAAPVVADIAEPDRTIAAVPIPSTTASANATSSLTPVPVVVPRADPAPAALSDAVDLVPLSIQTAIPGAVTPPLSGRIEASSTTRATKSVAAAGNAPGIVPPVGDPDMPVAAAVAGMTVAVSGEPATVAVPARFRPGSPAVVAAATPIPALALALAPVTKDPVAASAMVASPVSADRPMAAMPASAVATAPVQPVASPSAPSSIPSLAPTLATPLPIAAPVVVPPLPAAGPLAPTVFPAADSVGIGAATADPIIIAATAPVPVAPAAFLRQIVADAPAPAAPLAVVIPDAAAAAPSSPGIVFGAAIRAAASASDDRPVAVIPDPLAPIATPVAEVRGVVATTSAQQAPLDMSQPRWPHAMIERIDQLRDAVNAVDTRIRLIPDALGQIDVSIRQDGDTTHVTFAAEQAATRTMLQDAAPRLAAIAEERGVKLGQSTTDTGQQPPSQQRQAAPQNAANRAPVSTHADRDAVTDDGDGRVA